jgi:hypothetical protein
LLRYIDRAIVRVRSVWIFIGLVRYRKAANRVKHLDC